MEQQQLNFISTINAVRPENFQLQAPDPNTRDTRFYMEILGAQTEAPNFQNFQFTPQSMPGVIAKYKEGLSLMINHQKYGLNVGFGQTTDAIFDGVNLYIQAYLSKNKTTPNGPFGNTNELIDAVVDGFLKDASLSGFVVQTQCSICEKEGPLDPWAFYFGMPPDYDGCPHIRGKSYKIEDSDEEQKAIALIIEFLATELSLVWDGADDQARVVNKNLQLSNFVNNDFDNLTPEQHTQLVQFSKEYKQFSIPNPNNGGNNPMSVTQEQFNTLTAEKASLEAQVAAKDTQIASLETTKTSLEAQIVAKDQEIADFKQKETENEQAIKDGEVAREKYTELCIEAFKKTEPDTPAEELTAKVEAEKSALETFSLDQIISRTEGYESFAAKLYPGQSITKPEGGSDPTTPKRVRRTRGR